MLKSRRSLFPLLALALVFCGSAFAQQAASKPGRAVAAQLPGTAELDGYVKNLRYPELARAVSAMPPSDDRDYFAGILANRENRLDPSIALLEKAAPRLSKGYPSRAAVALHALADDYVKSYRYREAVRVYEDLLKNFSGQLDKEELQSTRDDFAAISVLRNAPPQTISFGGDIVLPTHRSQVLGTIDADLTVNGVTGSWILDTGANFSTVSSSFAKKLGVEPLKGVAQTQGITGAENKMQLAILPELKLGGATVRNVVLLVLDDSNLNVSIGKGSHYQINAILGYPVLQALGRVTFMKDGSLLAGPTSPSLTGGARIFMNMLVPLLQCQVEGRDVLFSFDTGADNSFFSVRYRNEFSSELKGLTQSRYAIGGAGGNREMSAYYLPEAKLGVGTTMVYLEKVPVLPALGTDSDKFFGNLGRDVTDAYGSFTIDFTNMRFELGKKISEAQPAK